MQLDTGVDTKTRLYMAAAVRNNPTALLPNTICDVMYPNGFGIRYGETASIDLNTLVVDQKVTLIEKNVRGTIQMVESAANDTAISGEPILLTMIADNAGADGYIMVEAYEGDNLLVSKFVSVEGSSFMVVALNITLEGAGEHTTTISDMTKTITGE